MEEYNLESKLDEKIIEQLFERFDKVMKGYNNKELEDKLRSLISSMIFSPSKEYINAYYILLIFEDKKVKEYLSKIIKKVDKNEYGKIINFIYQLIIIYNDSKEEIIKELEKISKLEKEEIMEYISNYKYFKYSQI